MRNAVYFALDFTGALLRRYLMISLLNRRLTIKNRYRDSRKWISAGFIAIGVVFYMATGYVPFVKKILYGNEEGMMASRASILPLFISLSFMLIYCLHFFTGKKSNIWYLVCTIYTINELVMFTLHSLFVTLMGGVSEFLFYLVMEENPFILDHFMAIFTIFEIAWKLIYQIIVLFLFYHLTGILNRNLICVREPNREQKLFLAVPSLMGLCFCILLRSIMYAYNDTEVRFLMDEYPESRLLIPMVSGLCLLSILLSSFILKKLTESSEKEMLVEVYQNRISDMEEHMKDVEHLYDGIRGMRHDMKNYVADLEILLQHREKGSGEYGAEIRRYLDGLCMSMEELDMKCCSGNPVTDVVLSRKIRRAQEKKIPFECNFMFPGHLGISAFDLSILLNNGLDNALEASEREENGYIRLDSYVKGNMFFIEIRNRYSGELHPDESGRNLVTNKPDPSIHGLGLKNMKGCAEKYYGTLRWEHKEDEFLLAVMLQGKEK